MKIKESVMSKGFPLYLQIGTDKRPVLLGLQWAKTGRRFIMETFYPFRTPNSEDD
jgi:hypothetical protein